MFLPLTCVTTHRGFGDRDFKANALISSTPDVAALVLAPHLDSFAIHASDGLWGVVSDQDAVDLVVEVIDKVSKHCWIMTSILLETSLVGFRRFTAFQSLEDVLGLAWKRWLSG